MGRSAKGRQRHGIYEITRFRTGCGQNASVAVLNGKKKRVARLLICALDSDRQTQFNGVVMNDKIVGNLTSLNLEAGVVQVVQVV
jgi:hypothetical protein